MTTDQLMGILRALLQIGGGIATALGWITSDQMNALTQTMLQAAGPIMMLIGTVWSIVANSKTSILTSAANMPEVKEIKLETKSGDVEAKSNVAALLKATPDNVK